MCFSFGFPVIASPHLLIIWELCFRCFIFCAQAGTRMVGMECYLGLIPRSQQVWCFRASCSMWILPCSRRGLHELAMPSFTSAVIEMLILNASLAWGPQPLDWDQSWFVSISMVRSEGSSFAPAPGQAASPGAGGGAGGWRGQEGRGHGLPNTSGPASSVFPLFHHINLDECPLPWKISWLLTTWGWVPETQASGWRFAGETGQLLQMTPVREAGGLGIKGTLIPEAAAVEVSAGLTGSFRGRGALWSCRWTVIRYVLP